MTAWEVGDLPRKVENTVRTGQSVQQITGYPALVAQTLPDGSPAAGLTVMRTPEDQSAAHRAGVAALLLARHLPGLVLRPRLLLLPDGPVHNLLEGWVTHVSLLLESG